MTNVIGMTLRRPPKRRMSTSSSISCFTDPAPRNSPALKKPCASRCAIANAYPAGPSPAASIMYPIWLIVDPASAFLMSSLAQPMIAPNSSVAAPTIATASRASGDRLKIGLDRTIR